MALDEVSTVRAAVHADELALDQIDASIFVGTDRLPAGDDAGIAVEFTPAHPLRDTGREEPYFA